MKNKHLKVLYRRAKWIKERRLLHGKVNSFDESELSALMAVLEYFNFVEGEDNDN